MDDLISRRAALDIINIELNGWLTEDERLHLEGVETGIEFLPTIDPVKHGRWKNKQMHDEELNEIQVFRHRCSECRFEICTTDETLWWQYCPNCGSKNGGEG